MHSYKNRYPNQEMSERVVKMIATETIKKGEEVFWNYGQDYWESRLMLDKSDINTDYIF